MDRKKENAAEAANSNKLCANDITITVDPQEVNAIQPYKLNVMLKQASKIVDMLIKIPHWLVTYDDMEFILQIVINSIRHARNRGE